MSKNALSADSAGLPSIIDGFAGRRVLLVGDMVADHYIKGKSSRISREAPVLILKYQDETVIPGQVGNTAANIAALGGEALLVGISGKDMRGDQLLVALSAAGVQLEGIVKSAAGATVTKTRILAGGHHTARQQVIRIDDDERLPVTEQDRLTILANMQNAAAWANAVVVSDYGYGVVDEQTWELAVRIATDQNIPLVLDSRYNLTYWKGATLITPNEEEALAAVGVAMDSEYDIEKVGEKLLQQTGCEQLIITRGNEGMALFQQVGKPVHLPVFGSKECTDVTGAGDTVVATATLSLASGATPEVAMVLANLAGALVVMKLGTATISRDEMKSSLELVPDCRISSQSVKNEGV